MSERKPRSAAAKGRAPLKVIKSEGQPVVVDLSATRESAEVAARLARRDSERAARRVDAEYMRKVRARQIGIAVARMNKAHALVEYGDKVMTCTPFWTSEGEFQPRYREEADLSRLLRNKKVCLPKVSARGKVSFEWVNPVALWMDHPQRRDFNEIINEPGNFNTPGKLNVWQGWGRKPRIVPLTDWNGEPEFGEDGAPLMMPDFSGEKCPRILAHIREVWCAAEGEGLFRWIIAWMANIVQKPRSKPGTALMIYGGQGTGKSIIIERVLAPILGSAYSMQADTKFLTKDFNNEMAGKLLVFADEAIFAGDPAAAARMKTFITGAKLGVRKLYKDTVSLAHHARVAACANPGPVLGHVLAMEEDDRRWTIAETSSHRVGDRAYFDALNEEIDNGGIEAFYAYLLKPTHLHGVDLYQPYRTASAVEQKTGSLQSPHAFLYECMRSGSLQIVMPSTGKVQMWTDSTAVAGRELHAAYLEWCADRKIARPALDNAFAKVVRQLIPRATKQQPHGQPREWVLPSLDEARADFAKWIGAGDDPLACARLWTDDVEGAATPLVPAIPVNADDESRRIDDEIPDWTEGAR